MDHIQLDQLSLAMHIFLMKRLRDEPKRLSALKNVWVRWLALPSFACKKTYVDAWMNAIEEGVEAVVTLATSESDFHNTLRQCSPCSVLWNGDQERLDFIRKWKALIRQWRPENILSGSCLLSDVDFYQKQPYKEKEPRLLMQTGTGAGTAR
jgi:hypothetical protein